MRAAARPAEAAHGGSAMSRRGARSRHGDVHDAHHDHGARTARDHARRPRPVRPRPRRARPRPRVRDRHRDQRRLRRRSRRSTAGAPIRSRCSPTPATTSATSSAWSSPGPARFAGRLAPDERHTYGWKRASILAAFANSLLLLVAIGSARLGGDRPPRGAGADRRRHRDGRRRDRHRRQRRAPRCCSCAAATTT